MSTDDVSELVEVLQRAIVRETFGDTEPHPAYLGLDSDQRRQAERYAEAVQAHVDAEVAAALEQAANDMPTTSRPAAWLRGRAAQVRRHIPTSRADA